MATTALARLLLVLATASIVVSCSSPSAQPVATAHPLDPLTAEEISLTSSVLRDAGRLRPSVRVVIVETAEPDKARVLSSSNGSTMERAARVVLYDWQNGARSETRVDLRARRIVSDVPLGEGDPPVRHVVLSRATEIAIADNRVIQALKRRGITDLARLTFLGGLFEGGTLPRAGGNRVISVTPYLWDTVGEFATVPGFSVRVDLTAGTVLDVQDAGIRGSPATTRAPARAAGTLKPLRVTQPDGPSFRIRGTEIEWDRWRLHAAVHPRRGLEVFDVAYRDGNNYRPVLYRGSLSEVITPYGDPDFGSWYPRDEGDYGMTSYSADRAQAIVGADAPDNAVFVPAAMAGPRGDVIKLERAMAVFERDGGILWRHAADARRARQLVLSAYATVDNYDYVMHWVFSQDGAIDVQMQLTGMMNIRPDAGNHDDTDATTTTTHFGHLVAPRISAPNHQHFFCYRLDLDVDGAANRVAELNTRNAQEMLRDRSGEWFAMEQRTLQRESEAQRDVELSTARRWLIANTGKRNSLGQSVAYALVPGENAPPFQTPTSGPRRRAAFLNHHLWVTRYNPAQVYASGDFVNIGSEGDGVAAWSRDDQEIVDQDVVLWYTFAVTHLPRPEDWPVMPAYTAGFRLVPAGFFVGNPTYVAK